MEDKEQAVDQETQSLELYNKEAGLKEPMCSKSKANAVPSCPSLLAEQVSKSDFRKQ